MKTYCQKIHKMCGVSHMSQILIIVNEEWKNQFYFWSRSNLRLISEMGGEITHYTWHKYRKYFVG